MQVKALYRLGEAADILGISYEALASRCRRNSVEYVQIRSWRYLTRETLAQMAPTNWQRHVAMIQFGSDV